MDGLSGRTSRVTDTIVRRKLLYIAIPIVVALVLFVSRGVLRTLRSRETTGESTDGQVLYARMCALCHSDAGGGYAAPASPALANPNFLAVADDAYLFENIARGRPGTRMSAWAESYGGPLSDEQVRAIVRHIRVWQAKPAVDAADVTVAGDAERGAQVYADHCVVCHGENGGGRDEAADAPDGAPSLNNPVFLDTASDGFIRYSIAEGRPGTPMAGYAGVLTDQQIDDLVAFIRRGPTE